MINLVCALRVSRADRVVCIMAFGARRNTFYNSAIPGLMDDDALTRYGSLTHGSLRYSPELLSQYREGPP